MGKVRFGIIGMGNMGKSHTRNFLAGKMPEAELAAVCDNNPDKLAEACALLGDAPVRRFADGISNISVKIPIW